MKTRTVSGRVYGCKQLSKEINIKKPLVNKRADGSRSSLKIKDNLLRVPANGYAFVYLSNSSNINVWFDEFWVTHKRGRILQENHYYPYGLQIASISSKAAGKMDNMYRYQGAYSEFEEETGWNDFELRTYDAQIGRWTGVDPYDQYASGYVGMGNNPINGVDPNGGTYFGFDWTSGMSTAWNRILTTGAGALAGGIIGAVSSHGNIDATLKGMGIGAAIGLGSTYGNYIADGANWAGKQFGGLFSGSEWNWLTKEALNELTSKYANRSFSSNGDKENYIGNNFEDNWHKYASGTISLGLTNYRKNTDISDQYDGGNDGAPTNIRQVIIDAKADVESTIIDDAGVQRKRFYRAAWFEVKATKNNIWLSTSGYQIKSELYSLFNSEPRAVALGIAQYNIVTTYGGDGKVGKSVYDLGARLGIQILSIQPKYRIKKGSVEVQFLHQTKFGNLPLFPTEYNHIMKYSF